MLVRIQGRQEAVNGEVSAQEPIGKLVRTLRREIVHECRTLPDACRRTETAVRASGFNLTDAKIVTIVDPTATCTRAEAPVGGLVEVVLRGPSSPR